jgi:hypothetical protein
MHNLLRFLELVCRELGATDAHFTLGGLPPEHDPRAVSAEIAEHQRLLARWSTPLDPDARAAAEHKMRALIESFAPEVEGAFAGLRPVVGAPSALDEALGLLARRARAEEAAVLDHASPEVWGSSEVPRDGLTVEDAVALSRAAASLAAIGESMTDLVALDDGAVRERLRDRGVEGLAEHTHARAVAWARALGPRASDAMRIRMARAIAATRAQEHGVALPPDLWMLVRPFANIYRLVLLFDGPPSALHVEAALLRMLPLIERLVLSLPPRDPVSRGARVTPLRRLRPV